MRRAWNAHIVVSSLFPHPSPIHWMVKPSRKRVLGMDSGLRLWGTSHRGTLPAWANPSHQTKISSCGGRQRPEFSSWTFTMNPTLNRRCAEVPTILFKDVEEWEGAEWKLSGPYLMMAGPQCSRRNRQQTGISMGYLVLESNRQVCGDMKAKAAYYPVERNNWHWCVIHAGTINIHKE